MNKTFITLGRAKVITLLLIAGLSLLVITSGCKKTVNSWEPDNPPHNNTPTVEQTFSMSILSKVGPMAKSWDADTWVHPYSQVPQTLQITGIGATAGSNYSTSCTVQDLLDGIVSVSIIPGEYRVTYTTPHIRTINSFSNNGWTLEDLIGKAVVGDVLDIAINNESNLGGPPVELTATLEDAMVIVEIADPSTDVVELSKYPNGGTCPFLLKDAVNSFHWAYVNETPLYLVYLAFDVERVVNASAYLKGNAYHHITQFGSTVTLNIPDMIINEVVVE